MTFKIFVSGYGIYEIEGTREEAQAEAETKRCRERARRALVWDAGLTAPIDKVTAEIARLWSSGLGVPTEMLRERARLLFFVTEPTHEH